MAHEECLSIANWKSQWQYLVDYPKRRVQVDVGCYRGRFMCQLAMNAPTDVVVGVEINREYAQAAKSLCASLGLNNVVVVNGDALTFFRDAVPPEVISDVHVYFPTPFPWAIGQKHKLVSAPFVDAVHRSLLPGGGVRILTDEVSYFREIESLFSPVRWWSSAWQPIDVGQPPGFLAGSPAEARYRREGRTIWALQALK